MQKSQRRMDVAKSMTRRFSPVNVSAQSARGRRCAAKIGLASQMTNHDICIHAHGADQRLI